MANAVSTDTKSSLLDLHYPELTHYYYVTKFMNQHFNLTFDPELKI